MGLSWLETGDLRRRPDCARRRRDGSRGPLHVGVELVTVL